MFIEIQSARPKQLRTEPRMKVLLIGELRSVRGSMGCRVLDLSRGGACIDADRAHDVGEEVEFRRGPLQVRGKIVWSRGNRFGVRFEGAIRATDLLIQMSHSRTLQENRPSLKAEPVSVAATSLSPSM